MSEVRVRLAADGEADAAAINLLHAEVNGLDRTVEAWAWEYRHGPWGPARIWLAEEGGRLLGHWAWIPFGMRDGARCFPAFKSEGLMVHADARGRGVARELIRAALESEAPGEGELIWTFPNTPALRILTGAGYRDVGRVDALLALRSPLAVAVSRTPLGRVAPCVAVARTCDRLWRRRLGSASDAGRIEQVARADERFDRLWKRVAPRYGLTLDRSARWVDWRFADDPFVDYSILALAGQPAEIDGYAVLYDQVEGPLRFGYISDWVADAGADAGGALMDAVLGHFAARDVDVILCYAIAGAGGPYPALEAGLRRAGPVMRRVNKTFIVRDASAAGAAARPLTDWCVSESFTEGVGF